MESKFKPVNLNVGLGNVEESQKRREAYEQAQKKAGESSLGAWARHLLDKAAGYAKK